jgi:DNA-binding response OmpR family regulator
MRILLVEDEPDLGAAILRTLGQEKYIVDWAQDGIAAWNHLENHWTHYHVGIFDWMLPKLSGIELCRRLRQKPSALPVLLLTARDGVEDKVQGLDAGADDYLTKPFSTAELLARVRALQRRSPQLQAQKLQVGNLTLDYSTSTILIKDAIVPLTAKEFQILAYFIQHPNQILTRDQIIDQIWEVQAEPISNVVAAQMRLLRKKLAEYGCADVIETVYGLGYKLRAES